jgi:hypothetical protein
MPIATKIHLDAALALDYHDHGETALRAKDLSYLANRGITKAPITFVTSNPQLICVIIHCNANKGLHQSKSEIKDVHCSSILANSVSA